MDEHEQQKVTTDCAEFVSKALAICPGPISRKMVMQKFLNNPKIKISTPDYVLPTRLAITQKEVMEEMSRSVEEIKQVNFSAKLASKHAILSTTITAGPTFSMRNITKVLGVHPRNISIAMQRHKITNDVGDVLWSLSIRRKRTDGCTNVAKTTALTWWASETRVNPNKANVTTKCLEAGMWDEKPTHYLMETQVL
jgi:hypothetical protein